MQGAAGSLQRISEKGRQKLRRAGYAAGQTGLLLKAATGSENSHFSFLPPYAILYSCKGGMLMIPKDPVMLLSFVNLKLRDYYKDLETLCEDLSIEQKGLEEKLAGIDYHYDREQNRFI